MRPGCGPTLRTPCATPGGMRSSREAPSPSTKRMRVPSVGEPCRTSSSTISMRSPGGTYQTSVCRTCRWKALMAPGASSLKFTWRTVKPSSPASCPSVSRPSSVRLPPSSVWRVSGTSATPSMRGAAPYACSWNARLASRLKSIRGPEDSTRSRLAREHAQQVLAVRVVAHRLGDALDVGRADPAHAVGDLLETRHHQSLARLDRLDEGRGLQQRLMGAGVEPGHAAAELLDVQRPGPQVRGIDVGDLQLAARRGRQPGGDVHHPRVVKVEARHRPRRARARGLLLDRHRAPGRVELHHAGALGVAHTV